MILKGLLEQAFIDKPADKWPTFDGMLLDRAEFLTSSQVASCLRQSFFEKNGKQFPHQGFRGNGFTERGKALESWLVEQLLPLTSRGFKFWFIGKQQRSFYDADIGLSGTPDGILELPDGTKILLEFKTYDPRSNTNNFPRRKHVLQTQQNMYLVNKCMDWKIKQAILWYINASDVFESYEFDLEYDEEAIALCKQRAEILWEAQGPEDLDPEGILNGDCEYCPAFRHCSAYVGTKKLMMEAAGSGSGNFLLPPVEALEITKDELRLINDYLEARTISLANEKTFETMKHKTKEVIKRLGGGFIMDGVALTYKEEPGKVTIDKAQMIVDGIDIEHYSKVGRPYGVLNVGKPPKR